MPSLPDLVSSTPRPSIKLFFVLRNCEKSFYMGTWGISIDDINYGSLISTSLHLTENFQVFHPTTHLNC